MKNVTIIYQFNINTFSDFFSKLKFLLMEVKAYKHSPLIIILIHS